MAAILLAVGLTVAGVVMAANGMPKTILGVNVPWLNSREKALVVFSGPLTIFFVIVPAYWVLQLWDGVQKAASGLRSR